MSEKHQISVRFRASAPFTLRVQGKLTLRVQGKLPIKMTFVYIIQCKDKSYYTGITWNLERRVREHSLRTKTCLQKSKVPVKLVYYEKFNNRIEAAKREKEIKGWRREKKEKLISQVDKIQIR